MRRKNFSNFFNNRFSDFFFLFFDSPETPFSTSHNCNGYIANLLFCEAYYRSSSFCCNMGPLILWCWKPYAALVTGSIIAAKMSIVHLWFPLGSQYLLHSRYIHARAGKIGVFYYFGGL